MRVETDRPPLLTPPGTNEVEVSLFGPGYGEALALHVGEGQWVLVDSCKERRDAPPAALHYLQEMGVDPATAVTLVVVSHWHEDHIKGLAEVAAACSSAKVVFSLALYTEDLLTWVTRAGESAVSSHAGVREMHAVIEMMEDGPLEDRVGTARSEQRLLQRVNGGLPCEVWALSPSDRSIRRAARQWLDHMEHYRTNGAVTPPLTNRNDTTVALWVEIGETALLLGGDLEVTTEDDMGWDGVLASQARPEGKAVGYKVPHHGSPNAHHPGVWTGMLTGPPIALLAPWSLGGKTRPQEGDLRRLCNLTPNVFCTSLNRRPSVARGRAVERTVRETVRSRYVADWDFGHVQVRFPATSGVVPPEAHIRLSENAAMAC